MANKRSTEFKKNLSDLPLIANQNTSFWRWRRTTLCSFRRLRTWVLIECRRMFVLPDLIPCDKKVTINALNDQQINGLKLWITINN